MRLVSLNIQQGGGQRVGRLAAALLALDPDIAVLGEFRPQRGGQALLDALACGGLPYAASTEPPSTWDGVAIVSKLPMTEVTYPFGDTEFGHRFFEVRIGELRIGAVYGALGSAIARWWPAFAPLAAERVGQPYVLVGDFNVGIAPDDGPPLRGAADFAQLLSSGWVDAWRAMHPSLRDASWYHRTSGNGFLIDHALLSKPLARRLRACDLSHDVRLSGVSDHSALVVDLDRCFV